MNTLYDLITILPFPLLAVLTAGGYAGIPGDNITVYILCLAFSVWMILLRNMKKRNRIRGIGIVAVFVAGLILAAGEKNRQFFIKEYMWVIWLLCITAGAFAAGILMSRNIMIHRAAAAALLIYCIAGTVLGAEISKETFALICLVLLVRLAEEIQLGWKKSGYADTKEHITRTAPLLLAVCLIVYAVPAPDEAYDWQFAKDMYNSAASFANRVYGMLFHSSDDYGSIGFSDSAGFGAVSGLEGSDEEVLIIKAGNTNIKDLRLVGCISGDFTGREWIFDTHSEGLSRMTDTIETSCAVRKFDEYFQSDFMQKTDIYCETLFYNTSYVFAPAKIRLEATKQKTAGITEKNGSLISAQRFGYDDSYIVSCYVLNYGNTDLGKMLGYAGEITEAEWEQAAKAENSLDKYGCSYEDYQAYREMIYDKYCHSYGVSEEVRDILDKIKSGSSDRYETAKRLEAYLQKMEYSTECGALPGYVTGAGSFLDYFLLTSRRGWCMHYATAFVLMANEMGIPCRYVQGYNVRKDISGSFQVTQNDAHAWPEVYFDNAGWVAFEPTPGYSVPDGWGTKGRSADAYGRDSSGHDTVDEQDEAEELPEIPGNGSAAPDPLIFIIPSAAVIGFLLLFYFIGRSASRKRYERMSTYDRFIYLTRQALRMLKLLGLGIGDEETLSEYTVRIMDSGREDVKDCLGFIAVYETVLYSDRELTEEDAVSAENTYRTLRGLVKKGGLRSRLLLLIKS